MCSHAQDHVLYHVLYYIILKLYPKSDVAAVYS